MAPPILTSFLVKVASRCNLDCDYCYVYHHADQSWRDMPKLLSKQSQRLFVQRLAEYVGAKGLKRCAVVFHGGEPLLAGAEQLATFAKQIRDGVPAQVDIGLQTNGLLLDDRALAELETANIGVSLSLDGPKQANDKHRTSRKGRSSFERVEAALERLKARPKSFAGVIAVIDPSTPPRELLSFFNQHSPPKLDFLLPDAHHLRPPPGRADDAGLYSRWLIEAFDVWLDEYPQLAIRTFEALLDAVSGLPSKTDAFGFGDVSLISIETDGSFHDLDVLKITTDGATRLRGTVDDTSIDDVSASPQLASHQRLLSREGLCTSCEKCDVVEICGGGSLPHRFDGKGFANPTVYCGEMQSLIRHVQKRMNELLTPTASDRAAIPFGQGSLDRYELAEDARPFMNDLCEDAEISAVVALRHTLRSAGLGLSDTAARVEKLDDSMFRKFATHPGVMAWRHTIDAESSGRTVYSVDGRLLQADKQYLELALGCLPARIQEDFAVAEEDPWLRMPFGDAIRFENTDIAQQAIPVVREALDIIQHWRPALAEEMRLACKAIQFVSDPLADPDKIVSFSDNSVPGALYVSVTQGRNLIDPFDLADSLIHEHRHQKLYLLERLGPTVQPTKLMVRSPWREDLRPPSGLLHACFVFVELRRFWTYVLDQGPQRLHNRAVNQLRDTEVHLIQAFDTLDQCPLTSTGRELVSVLRATAKNGTRQCLSA